MFRVQEWSADDFFRNLPSVSPSPTGGGSGEPVDGGEGSEIVVNATKSKSKPRSGQLNLSQSLPIGSFANNNGKVDCNSGVRQATKLADTTSKAAGAASIAFGALGAAPPAAALGTAAGISEAIAVAGGMYIGRTEGDWQPLLSTAVGKIGAALGKGAAIFFGTSIKRINSVIVTKNASKEKIDTTGYAAGFVEKIINQQCP